LLCHTYRFHGHHVGDVNRAYYRSKEEEELWKRERDPLQLLANWLMSENLADAGIFAQIEREVRAEAEAAVAFALNAPYPAPEEVTKHVYV
jgi:pyruvate dehydrogenase E1 component alpha subunit